MSTGLVVLVVREPASCVQVVYWVICDRAVAADTAGTAAPAGEAKVCVVCGVLCSLLPCQAILFLCYSLLDLLPMIPLCYPVLYSPPLNSTGALGPRLLGLCGVDWLCC